MKRILIDRLFVSAVAAALVSMIVLFSIFATLWVEVRIIRDSADENTTWATANAQIDLLKLSNSLRAYDRDPTPAHLAPAQLHYELLQSRLHIVTQGEIGTRLRDVDNGQSVINALREVADAMEADVYALTPETAYRAVVWASRLEAQRALLQEVIADVSSNASDRQSGFREQFSGLLLQAIASLVFLTLFSAVVGLMLLRERRRRVAADVQKDAALATEAKASKAKTEFLSLMSHELRTPLNAILGFAQLLQSNQKTPLNKQQQKAVMRIMQGGTHLLNLINDVLDLSKIESGREEVADADVELNELVAECLDFLRTMGRRRGVTMTFTPPEKRYIARGDYLRLKQVLLNLLSNAIKYNREGGFVDVWLDETGGGSVAVHIRDTGFGIPAEDHSELFKPFTRLGAENTDIEGTGIGLTLSKQMIELMGGALSFESTKDIGSVFWIDVPGRTENVADTSETRVEDVVMVGDFIKETAPGLAFKVLYVEDNPTNIALMEDILADVPDTSMATAHNAELGIEIADVIKPNLILMDINLPGINGIEALSLIRQRPGLEQVPVVAITGDARSSSVDAGLRAGFFAYLTKPLIIDDLIAIIDGLKPKPELRIAGAVD